MKKQPPSIGTRDFHQDAAEGLQTSDTPHILISGFDGSRWRYRSANITSVEGVRWFRQAVNEFLDEIEGELS